MKIEIEIPNLEEDIKNYSYKGVEKGTKLFDIRMIIDADNNIIKVSHGISRYNFKIIDE